MTRKTSRRRRRSVRRSSLQRNASRPEVTKAIRKVAAAYLKLYSIPVWRDHSLRPAYNAAWQQMSAANAVVRSLARTENERHTLHALITKAEAIAAAKAKHNLRYTSRGTLRHNSTRYTTRSPVRPDIHVDEHSSEAEIVQAWRSGRLGIKTAERIRIARPAVYRKLVQLAQNGISFQWRRTTNRPGYQEWRTASHTRFPTSDLQWEIDIRGSDASGWDWAAEYNPAETEKYRFRQGTARMLKEAQADSEAWLRRTATRTTP